MAVAARPAVRIGCAVVGIALFGLAYANPAIGTCSRDPAREITWFDNSTLLFFGWLGVFALQIGWFANIPYLAQIIALLRGARSGRRRLLLHATLLIVGSLTLQPMLGMELWHNEAWSEPVCQLGGGFWLWSASHLVILAGAVLLLRPAASTATRDQ